jgi:DNA (cytosine-5)-methyltransferase 1
MAELGYGVAYRILDAQYFGVAQRRRRVFVVGNARSWQRAAAVLFERHSLSGDSAPRRKTGKVTPAISASGTGVRRTKFNSETGFYIPTDVAKTLTTGIGKRYDSETDTSVTQSDNVAEVTPTLGCEMVKQVTNQMIGNADAYFIPMESPVSFSATIMAVAMRESGQGYWMRDEVAGTLRAEGEDRPSRPSHVIQQTAIVSQTTEMAVAQPYIGGVDYENNAHGMDEATGPLLKGSPTGGGRPLPAVATAMQVRRLTPVECERLQGFPDDYTNVPYRNKPASDGPRYRALGNSMAVPVITWLGKRIQAVNKIS